MTSRATAACVTLTLRLKFRPESYAWLNAAAVEVNQTWNFCNERAATVLGNLGRWLNEWNTSRVCSQCGALSGPQGLRQLAARACTCSGCGEPHDRDVNAARNILARAKVLASVSGAESSDSPVPPRRLHGRRGAGTETARTAA